MMTKEFFDHLIANGGTECEEQSEEVCRENWKFELILSWGYGTFYSIGLLITLALQQVTIDDRQSLFWGFIEEREADMDFDKFWAAKYLWLLIGVVLMILEFALPGFVVFFFGLGAMIVGAACWIWPITLNEQLLIFIIASLVMLVTLRRWIKGIFVGYTSSEKALGELTHEFMGQRATVTSAIVPGRPGKVEFRGTQWEAESDEKIDAGEMVEIVGQESIRLKVKKA
jgi:membrane protein implicated in regulation of membrane protease activity